MAKFNMFDFRMDLTVLTGRQSINDVTPDCARAVRRRIARHHSIQENRCNRNLSERESAEEIGVEKRLADFFGDSLAEFAGDPRGVTVKLKAWKEGNPQYDAYVKEWGEPYRLKYFNHDWGGDLIFVG